MKTLLIAEDEKQIRRGIRAIVERSGLPVGEVLECKNGLEALALLEAGPVDVMIADIRMPGMDGLELVRRAAELAHPPLVLAISGYSEFSYAVEMLRHGVRDYLLKPVAPEKLVKALANLEGEIAAREEAAKGLTDKHLLRALLSEPQLEGAQAGTGHEGKNSRRIAEAMEYLHEHFREDVDMAQLSGLIGMNYAQFSYLFKQRTGMGYLAYLKALRLDESKRLLCETGLRIRDISAQTGFKSDKHFMKVFREAVGISPGEYRRLKTERALTEGGQGR